MASQKNKVIAADQIEASIVAAPKKACKPTGVFKPRNANDQAPADSHANRIVFASAENDCTTNNKRSYYQQLLVSKRIISSDEVRKTRLIERDAIEKSVIESAGAEDDETFFENLKNRINTDIQQNNVAGTSKALPKRLPSVRKRKNLFDNETLNLMKKFRGELAAIKSVENKSEDEYGVFTIENRPNGQLTQNQENMRVPEMTMEAPANISVMDPQISKNRLLTQLEKAGPSDCDT